MYIPSANVYPIVSVVGETVYTTNLSNWTELVLTESASDVCLEPLMSRRIHSFVSLHLGVYFPPVRCANAGIWKGNKNRNCRCGCDRP